MTFLYNNIQGVCNLFLTTTCGRSAWGVQSINVCFLLSQWSGFSRQWWGVSRLISNQFSFLLLLYTTFLRLKRSSSKTFFYLYFDSWQAILTIPMLEGHFSPKNSRKYISVNGVIFSETNKLKHETVGISSKKLDKKFCIIMRLVEVFLCCTSVSFE